MRIGIDASSWSNRRGYGRFTRGLLTALIDLDRTREYVFFVDEQTNASLTLPDHVKRVVAATSEAPTRAASANSRRSIRDMMKMAAAVRSERLDLVFFPTVYTYFPVSTRGRILVGIHDTIAEDFPSLVFPDLRARALWSVKSYVARWQADFVLTVSEYAKGRIIERFAIPKTRVFVIDEAPDPVFRPPAVTDRDGAFLTRLGIGPDDRLVVYAGGINPHKNLENLVRSIASVRRDKEIGNVRLVIVGDLGDPFTPGLAPLRRTIEVEGVEEGVTFTGFLSDEELAKLLGMATIVTLPSMAEGFGLPAVEGAACGAPVIATRNSPLPQLLEGGGIFIDPMNPDELTVALRTLLSDEPRRASMARSALERAGRLTWKRSAEQMMTLLETIERS